MLLPTDRNTYVGAYSLADAPWTIAVAAVAPSELIDLAGFDFPESSAVPPAPLERDERPRLRCVGCNAFLSANRSAEITRRNAYCVKKRKPLCCACRKKQGVNISAPLKAIA